MSPSPDLLYPYVVVRWMACVYRRQPVWFGLGPDESREVLVVPGPTPSDRANLSPAQREAVIEAAATACQRSAFRQCVVFAPSDAVYVEPDGSRSSEHPPPSGGVLG